MVDTIGKRIQALMNDRKWKRPQLRSALKEAGLLLSVEMLRLYVNDKSRPGPEVRRYLAKVFNTTESYIEFGTEGKPEQLPFVPASKKPHPEARLLAAFNRLLPDQQQRFVAEIEALAQTNMALGQLVLREVKYNLNAENLPLAPPLPSPAQKKGKARK